MCWNIILTHLLGSSWPWSYCSWIYNYLCNQCLSPLMLWARKISIGARCTTLCDKVCHWLAAGRCFFPGPPVSSANKSDRHDITEILLKVALNTIKQLTCCLVRKQVGNNTLAFKYLPASVREHIFSYIILYSASSLFSYNMAITSYISIFYSVSSLLGYNMAITSYISTRRWCSLCTIPTC